MRKLENFCFWLLGKVAFNKWYNRHLLNVVWYFGITRPMRRNPPNI